MFVDAASEQVFYQAGLDALLLGDERLGLLESPGPPSKAPPRSEACSALIESARPPRTFARDDLEISAKVVPSTESLQAVGQPQ